MAINAELLWAALDESGEIVTGGWTGMTYEELPDHVKQALANVIEKLEQADGQ